MLADHMLAPLIKLIDFGYSLDLCGTMDAYEQDLMSNLIMGTITYVAPELIRSDGNFNIESDMWSIGVIIFSLIAGRHPFYDTNNSILFNKIL